MKVAAIQMVTGTQLAANLAAAEALLAQAAAQGAELAVLPEYFCAMGRRDADKLALQEPLGDGPIQRWLAAQASALGLWIVGGTLPLSLPEPSDSHVRNACLVFSPAGERVAVYDKIHLFKFDDGTRRYDEAATLQPGREPVLFELPSRDGHRWRVGLSVCYDLRFPELYRTLAARGADLLLVPSAFTHVIGQAHWEVLLRARAIENLSCVVAAAQGGVHENGRRTWGHSMVIDAWGQVLADHAEGPGLALAELDPAAVAARRAQLPALAHRVLGVTPEAAAALRAPDHGWRAGVRELARLWRQDGRRWLLWSLLVVLVAVLLVTLVVLARRFEMEQVQRALERDNADAVVDLRHALSADAQRLRQLTAAAPSTDLWEMKAQDLLVAHPAWLRLEWRDAALHLKGERTSPFTSQPLAPPVDQTPLLAACADARRLGAAGFAPSRFVPREGLGVEVMPMCVLVVPGNGAPTYAIAYYALDGVLNHLLGEPYKRRQTVSLTEPDGTRLAVHGSPRRGARIFTSQQMLDLPGNTMVLRMDGWRAAPDLFPNVLTALVTVLAVALITVLVMLARDFRRRQQAEGELADALAFRKAMEDSLVTGLRARDLQGRISYVNPAFCAMVGYDAPELIGHDGPPPYWPPELADSYGRRTAARLAAGGPPRQGVESEFQRKDGSRLPVLIIEAPLITATGKHSGWMGAVIDLSEQRRIEEQQRAAQERLQATARLAAVGEMASLLSHELNQPLAAISSYANGSLNLLHGQEEGGVSLQDVRVALGRIADQAGRAGRVINSVHELARRGATARAAVAPQALVEAVLPLVQLQARKLGASVVVQVPAGLPDVGCEPTMVEQVLLNLARNGLQAMAGRRGERLLTIAAERVGGEGPRQWVAFSVADTGEGIAPEVADQLFTPFFTTKAEGMGLGLSLCRTVVEQHGGALDHAPNTPHGTVFRFTLPVAVPARNIDEIAV